MHVLMLGPLAYVNHSCRSNTVFVKKNDKVYAKVIKDIAVGDEITINYGKHYFGDKNCDCRCDQCRKKESCQEPEVNSTNSYEDRKL